MNAAQTLHLALPQFQAFSILLVRIAGIVSVFPILNTRTIPMLVKTGLVTMLGLVLTPIIQLPSLPTDPVIVIAGIGSEFLIGLTIGLAVRLLFALVHAAGDWACEEPEALDRIADAAGEITLRALRVLRWAEGAGRSAASSAASDRPT